MEHVKSPVTMTAAIITKQCTGLIIEMERLLIIWLDHQNQRNMPNSFYLFKKKKRRGGPERTYVPKEAASAPGHKASKDRLMLLLEGNASRDFKLKPLLGHCFLNLRVLRCILKASPPAIWKANVRGYLRRLVLEPFFPLLLGQENSF